MATSASVATSSIFVPWKPLSRKCRSAASMIAAAVAALRRSDRDVGWVTVERPSPVAIFEPYSKVGREDKPGASSAEEPSGVVGQDRIERRARHSGGLELRQEVREDERVRAPVDLVQHEREQLLRHRLQVLGDLEGEARRPE